MKRPSRNEENRFRAKPSLLLGALIVLGMLFAGPVAADQKHKRDKRGHHGTHYVKHHAKPNGRHLGHGHRPVPAPPVVRRPVRVVAPTLIRTPRVDHYRPYYRGRVFYEPHRHHHSVYQFPVYRNDRRFYEPHYYCNGHLYRVNQVAFGGPHFSVSIAF